MIDFYAASQGLSGHLLSCTNELHEDILYKSKILAIVF